MDKRLGFFAFLIYGIANCLVIYPNFAQAANDPPGSNADAYDGILMERRIIQMHRRGPFDPKDLAIYSEIESVLEVADQLPEFGKALRLALSKEWRFGVDGIEKCKTELTRYAPGTFQKVACQWEKKVVINPDFYFTVPLKKVKRRMSESDLISALKQNQKDELLHQMLLGVHYGQGISTDSMAKVIAVLTQEPSPSPSELQRVLESNGYGVYGTHSDCDHTASNQELIQPIDGLKSSVESAIGKILNKADLFANLLDPQKQSKAIDELNADPNSNTVFIGGDTANEIAHNFEQRTITGAPGYLISQGTNVLACVQNMTDSKHTACTLAAVENPNTQVVTVTEKDQQSLKTLTRLMAPVLFKNGDNMPTAYQKVFSTCTKAKLSQYTCGIFVLPETKQ
jgi:hypothetical protein